MTAALLNAGIPIPTVPVLDVKTGIIDPAWFRFFLALWNRTGGAIGVLGAPGGASGNIQYNANGAFGGLTNTQVTALINLFTATLSGAVPASGGGTTNFLRADGSWSPAGSAGPESGALVIAPTIGWEASTLVYAGTFTFTEYAEQAGSIARLRASVGGSGGSITATVSINGTPVTGLNAVTVNAAQTFTATGGNTYIIGDKITLVLAIASGAPAGAAFTIISGPLSAIGPTIGWEAGTPIYNGTFTYTEYAAQAGTIQSLRTSVGGAGGSVSATVKINGAPVTGLNGVTVNTNGVQSFAAAGANTYAAGDKITLVLVIMSGAPAGAVFTILCGELPVTGPTIGWEAWTPIYAGTFTFTEYAAGIIQSLRASVGPSGGSVTATVNINGTPVTGINAVTVNTSGVQTFVATDTSAYSAGDVITLVLAIASGAPSGAVFTLIAG